MSLNTPRAFLSNVAPLHEWGTTDGSHLTTEYRAWVTVVAPGAADSDPLQAASLYLMEAMKRCGAQDEKIRPDVDRARDEGGKPATLTVNGTEYEAVELAVFLVKARAAVVHNVGTVVAVVPYDQDTISVELRHEDGPGNDQPTV